MVLGESGPFFSLLFYFILHNVASHLGLRSLTMSHLWDARLKWVKINLIITSLVLVISQNMFKYLVLYRTPDERKYLLIIFLCNFSYFSSKSYVVTLI